CLMRRLLLPSTIVPYTTLFRSDCQAASPVRVVESIEVVRDGRFVLLAVTANAFLHHMVRNLVGSLVYVGDGRRPVGWLREVLDADRKSTRLNSSHVKISYAVFC